MNNPEKKSSKNPRAKRIGKPGTRPIDRRIQKTKQHLSDALVALILEKGYDKVSIQDIIDKANVGRSTFYLHYENKEQLLLWGHDHLRNLILGDGESKINFLSFYQHVAAFHAMATSVLSQESGPVVMNYLNDIFLRNIQRLHPASTVGKEARGLHALRAEAAAAALVRLMTAWLSQGMRNPPEEMAEESAGIIKRIMFA